MGESFKSRMPLHEAQFLAENLKRELEKSGMIVWVCGSVRRGKPEVGDLDLVVVGELGWLTEPGRPWRFVDGGERKCTLDYEGRQVNVLRSAEESLGAATLYFTGNATFNLIMRRKAKARGWKLNEYGLWNGTELLAARTEPEIFEKLDMRWHDPAERSK